MLDVSRVPNGSLLCIVDGLKLCTSRTGKFRFWIQSSAGEKRGHTPRDLDAIALSALFANAFTCQWTYLVENTKGKCFTNRHSNVNQKKTKILSVARSFKALITLCWSHSVSKRTFKDEKEHIDCALVPPFFTKQQTWNYEVKTIQRSRSKFLLFLARQCNLNGSINIGTLSRRRHRTQSITDSFWRTRRDGNN